MICKKVTHLGVMSNDMISDNVLVSVGENCKELEVLGVGDCSLGLGLGLGLG